MTDEKTVLTENNTYWKNNFIYLYAELDSMLDVTFRGICRFLYKNVIQSSAMHTTVAQKVASSNHI